MHIFTIFLNFFHTTSGHRIGLAPEFASRSISGALISHNLNFSIAASNPIICSPSANAVNPPEFVEYNILWMILLFFVVVVAALSASVVTGPGLSFGFSLLSCLTRSLSLSLSLPVLDERFITPKVFISSNKSASSCLYFSISLMVLDSRYGKIWSKVIISKAINKAVRLYNDSGVNLLVFVVVSGDGSLLCLSLFFSLSLSVKEEVDDLPCGLSGSILV